MERIDQLENDILGLQDMVCSLKTDKNQEKRIIGESQNLRDKEIIDFIGDDLKNKSI